MFNDKGMYANRNKVSLFLITSIAS